MGNGELATHSERVPAGIGGSGQRALDALRPEGAGKSLPELARMQQPLCDMPLGPAQVAVRWETQPLSTTQLPRLLQIQVTTSDARALRWLDESLARVGKSILNGAKQRR